MRRASYQLLAVMTLLLLITACGGGTPPTDMPPTVPNATEGSGLSSTPDCDKRALEQWLQRASFLTQEFADLINGSLTKLPSQFVPILNQVSEIQTALQSANPPGCAQQHAQMIDQMLTEALTALGRYSQGQAVDLVNIVTNINQQLDTVRGIEGQLNTLYGTLP